MALANAVAAATVGREGDERMEQRVIDDQGRPEPLMASDEVPNLRWILVHVIEEHARHDGHADLLREAIDGQTGE